MASLTARFETFVMSGDFPCVGAKSALALDALDIIECGDFSRPVSDLDLYRALGAFGDRLDPASTVVRSFAALFSGPADLDEEAFETLLWNRLQSLHNLDAASGRKWLGTVSSDPESPHFSMSIGGHAYFVVGMHPNASRPARRFDYPALVFNSNAQFDRLKQGSRYDRMQSVIRERDFEIAGSINPMLGDFGDISEAVQYSGRKTRKGWTAPFEQKEPR